MLGLKRQCGVNRAVVIAIDQQIPGTAIIDNRHDAGAWRGIGDIDQVDLKIKTEQRVVIQL